MKCVLVLILILTENVAPFSEVILFAHNTSIVINKKRGTLEELFNEAFNYYLLLMAYQLIMKKFK